MYTIYGWTRDNEGKQIAIYQIEKKTEKEAFEIAKSISGSGLNVNVISLGQSVLRIEK